jgi:hypothetical protein
MTIKMLDGGGDGIDIARRHDNSIDPIAHNIAGLARHHLGQTARGRFVGHLGAALELGGKNVNGALGQMFLDRARKANRANVIAPKFFEIRFGFLVHGTEQPEFGVLQIQTVPRFQ